MRKNYEVIDCLLETGVMAIARVPGAEKSIVTAKALLKGGVKIIEFSMVMPDCLEAISLVKKELGNQMFVGAGTVLDAESARAAIFAGAEFVVSPTIDEGTIEIAHRYGKPVVPGTMTANEILRAYELGAQIVKVFPGALLGADYIKAILAPLPHIPLIPTGGVTLDNAEELIRAGSSALGLGSNLVRNDLISQGKFDEITNISKQFIELVKKGRFK